MKNLLEILEVLVHKAQAESALLVSEDGLVIESFGAENDNLTGVLTASLLSVAGRFAEEIRQSELDHLYLQTGKGFVLFRMIKDGISLCLITQPGTKLGLAIMYLEKYSKQLQEEL